MADIEGRLKITWPNTLELAKLADEMEFEAMVPVARWRGFGGKLNPAGPGFETYTWAAGVAASTQEFRPSSPPRIARSIIRSPPPSNAR